MRQRRSEKAAVHGERHTPRITRERRDLRRCYASLSFRPGAYSRLCRATERIWRTFTLYASADYECIYARIQNGELRSLQRVVYSSRLWGRASRFGALFRSLSLSLFTSSTISPLPLLHSMALRCWHFSPLRLGTFRFFPRRGERIESTMRRYVTPSIILFGNSSARQMSIYTLLFCSFSSSSSSGIDFQYTLWR